MFWITHQLLLAPTKTVWSRGGLVGSTLPSVGASVQGDFASSLAMLDFFLCTLFGRLEGKYPTMNK